jgi:acyl carrier protein
MRIPIDRNKVREGVYTLFKEFVLPTAYPMINDTADSLKDLGLDSLDGVEFACELDAKFGCKIPLKENPLVEGTCKEKRGRLVGAVVDYVMALLEER